MQGLLVQQRAVLRREQELQRSIDVVVTDSWYSSSIAVVEVE